MTEVTCVLEKADFKKLSTDLSFRATDEAIAVGTQPADYVDDKVIKERQQPQEWEQNVSAQFDTLCVGVILPELAFSIEAPISKYYILSLPEHSLREPIEIIVDIDEFGRLTVWNDEFGVSGIGDTKEEALAEFEELIFSDYTSLSNASEQDLTQGAKELLDKYKHYLGENI